MGTPFFIEKVINTFYANKLLGIRSPFNPCTPTNLDTKGPLKFSYITMWPVYMPSTSWPSVPDASKLQACPESKIMR